MAYDNTNSGALFKNDRKEKDSHPDYKGQLNVEGVEFWVSAWIKTSAVGQKFMSLALTLKDAKEPLRAPPKPAPKPKTGFDDMDSDIPF